VRDLSEEPQGDVDCDVALSLDRLLGAVRRRGREGRFDDVIGNGWVVLTAAGEPQAALSGEQRSFLGGLDARFASLDDLTDLDGRLTGWLSDNEAGAVIIRPTSTSSAR
jgi:hypothetical protein